MRKVRQLDPKFSENISLAHDARTILGFATPEIGQASKSETMMRSAR